MTFCLERDKKVVFIDDQIPTPDWLHITNLDDLKARLIAVLVVIMAVLFVGQLVEWSSGKDVLVLGIAIALVIAALRFFLGWKESH